MKYNGEYEVKPSFINESGAIHFEKTGNGEYIIGTKGGRTFFIKRNIHLIYPDPSLPEAVYKAYKEQADKVVPKQERLRKLMSGLSWDKDYIVVEERNFWDSDNKYTTITACVPDKLPDKQSYADLSLTDFIDLARKAAKVMMTLHSHGVIHGDLKEQNLIVGKVGGKLQPYLIDFDAAYPADEIPEDVVGGTEGYMSPEVMIYNVAEGEGDPSTITYATDIFTLALVYHKWWTGGNMPDIDMEGGSVAEAMYFDKKVTFDKKFNVIIGDKCGATLISLLNWMVNKDSANRPTAQQVLDVLEDRLAVPTVYHIGKDVQPLKLELWPQHTVFASVKTAEELKSIGIVGFEKINVGGGTKGLKYRVVFKSGEEKKLSIEELCDADYVNRLDPTIDSPWPDHDIEFEPVSVIFAKGYCSITRKTTFVGLKRYQATSTGGRSMDVGVTWLLSEGLAHVKAPDVKEINADTPWEEHASAYNMEKMSKRGVIKITRVEIGGEHRYNIEYGPESSGGARVVEGVPAKNLSLLGFFK